MPVFALALWGVVLAISGFGLSYILVIILAPILAAGLWFAWVGIAVYFSYKCEALLAEKRKNGKLPKKKRYKLYFFTFITNTLSFLALGETYY